MHYLLTAKITGFKRMLVNNIRQITITPTTAIQLILGSNGSGKSSLLDQLTPLPAENASYERGGSKVTVWMKDGLKITCTSRFDDKAVHSFMIEDDELNPGGTEKVQREMVEKHFKITQATHDLQRGAEKFTSMSPAKRREWFTRMCDQDYTYAMSAFEKLKDHANGLGKALNINRKNLVSETAKIMSEAEETKLDKEVADLLEELNVLTAERMPLGTSSQHHLNERSRALKTLDDVAMRLLRTRVVVPLEYTDGREERNDWGELKKVSFRSVAEIDAEIDRLKHIVTGKQTMAVTLNEQFDKYQKQSDILSKTGAEGAEGLNRQIKELHDVVQVKTNAMRFGLVFDSAKSALTAFDAIEAPLTDAIRILPENTNRKFGRARMQELQDQLMLAVDKRNGLATSLQRLEARKEHADHHRGKDQHTCPACHHTWTVGINEAEYQKLVDEINATRELFKSAEEKHLELVETIKVMESYFSLYRDVMSYTKSVVILKPFWEHLLISQTLFDSPPEAAVMVRNLRNDLVLSIDVEAALQQIDDLKRLRLQAEEAGDANLAEVQKQLEDTTERLGLITAELARVQIAVSNYSEYRRQLNASIELGAEVERYRELAQGSQYEHIEALRREAIHQCIGQVEDALALKQESLRAVKMQKGIVQALEKQVQQLERQELAAKTMVKALSPTHGLIAEGLLGFIRNFTGRMNAFINRIWTYPLQIIPTGYDTVGEEQTAELDYKFKMLVERDSNIVPDVSKGSDGQKEIIDMAYMLMSMESSGLSDSPLMLDEFGKSLDDEHRFAAIAEIKHVMENGNFPQLYMISHYAASYSSFTNSDICVIDDRNIVVPAGRNVNEHVKIVH